MRAGQLELRGAQMEHGKLELRVVDTNSLGDRYLLGSRALKACHKCKIHVSFIWELSDQSQGRNPQQRLNIHYNRHCCRKHDK